MRALITGITGFVGKYLAKYLRAQGIEVYGTTSQQSKQNGSIIWNDLSNELELIRLLNEIKPDQIYHLAGLSSVKASWDNKVKTFDTNVNLTVNLLEAARNSLISNEVRVLTVGSSEEYGKVDEGQIPIRENIALQSMNPYGISKAAVSQLAKLYYSAYGLKVAHVRPFNHIGPGQSLGFVVSDFASQIIKIEKEEQENVIYVGNLEAQRDFTDVRDIVRAYYLLLQSPSTIYGDVYNVCSGNSIQIKKIVQKLIRLSDREIELKVDMSRMRPIDVPNYVGDSSKIKELTGWDLMYPIETTLSDVLTHLRKQ